MFSGDSPPSFTAGGQSDPQILSTGDVYIQPPSEGGIRHGEPNSYPRYPGVTSNRSLIDDDDNTKAPSYSDLGQAQGVSNNRYGNRSLTGNVSNAYDADGKPLSISDMMKGTVSQNSGGVGAYKGEKAAPNLSDVDPRGASATGGTSDIVLDDPEAQELVGISLVGKNFKKFYPNAYYKDKEDEN